MVQSRLKSRWLVPFSVLSLLVLASLACASQSADKVKGFDLQRSYTLKSGEQLSGDQVILAYDIKLSPGSVIDGNATLTGNSVTLGAEINGDAVVVADNVSVGDTAHVTRDLIVCSKNFEQSPAAQIDGQVKEECTNSGSVSFSNTVESGWDAWRGSILFRISSSIAGALLFGAVAALGTVLVPQPLVRMSESVQRSPWRAGGIGFLTMLVAIGLTVIYSISLLLVLPVILLPFVIVGWMIVALFSLLGWVALAQPFGVFLVRRFGMDHQPRMVSAAVGGITLALLIVTCVFWLGVVLIWAATDMTVVRATAAILALISTTTIWSLWALDEYGISVDGTPHEREKPKRITSGDEDPRLGLLLSLLTPDERDTLKSRITEGLNAEGEVVSLADLLADQASNDLYEHEA